MSQPSELEFGSILKAIDGSHLPWTDFRRDVLLPFGIVMTEDTLLKERLPSSILSFLQIHLQNLPSATELQDKWRDQVLAGQGFNANSTVFPPNLLPSISAPTKLQRCQSPKMNREGLPRRVRPTQDALFELPHAKPLYASAFAYEAFSDVEHKVLPSFAVPSGTNIDFTNGKVVSGRLMPCPFLIFEYIPGSKDDDIERALNMCAVSATQCLRGIQDLFERTSSYDDTQESMFAFSCAINDTVAVMSSHTINAKGHFTMSALCRFELEKLEHFQTFQVWIRAIEEWACKKLLSRIKASLDELLRAGMTPPASPMPSLTLSIDTLRGPVPNLMRALRGTYSTIKWHAPEEHETPIMSSIAACGTPWEGRRFQSIALASDSPTIQPYQSLARYGQNSRKSLPPLYTKTLTDYAPIRPSPLSPHYTTSPEIDWETCSPCRPYTLSPCTPAPDMPWTAKSPMLVLQKRVEIAMDEIQELRRQMEVLQNELAARSKPLENSEVSTFEPKASMDEIQTTTCDGSVSENQGIESVVVLPAATSTGKRLTNQFLVQLVVVLLAAFLLIPQTQHFQLGPWNGCKTTTGTENSMTVLRRFLQGELWSIPASAEIFPKDVIGSM